MYLILRFIHFFAVQESNILRIFVRCISLGWTSWACPRPVGPSWAQLGLVANQIDQQMRKCHIDCSDWWVGLTCLICLHIRIDHVCGCYMSVGAGDEMYWDVFSWLKFMFIFRFAEINFRKSQTSVLVTDWASWTWPSPVGPSWAQLCLRLWVGQGSEWHWSTDEKVSYTWWTCLYRLADKMGSKRPCVALVHQWC